VYTQRALALADHRDVQDKNCKYLIQILAQNRRRIIRRDKKRKREKKKGKGFRFCERAHPTASDEDERMNLSHEYVFMEIFTKEIPSN
jgi:hypothetical protein